MSLLKSRFIEMFKNSETLRLDQIAEVTMGQSPDSSSYNSVGKGIPFYQGKTEFTDKYIGQPSTWCTSPTRIAKENDILMSVRAPVGNVNIATEECCIGRGLSSIRPQNGFNSEFIFEALEQKKEELENKATGSTFKAINKDIVLSIQIPNTSISIQKEYSNFVKQIEKSKFLLQQILKKLELLKKSRFIELFGSTDLSLQKDDWVEIKNIGEVVSGSTPKTTNESYWGGENKWITPAELSSNTYVITKTDRYLTDEGVKSCSLRKLPKDTVLLTSRAPIGKVAIAGTEMYCNQGFKNIICNEKIRPKYLFYLLKNNVRYLEYLGRGATFKEISKSIVENVKIPLFPLQDQDRFIEFAEQIDKSKFNVFQDQTAAQVKVIVVLHHIC